MTELQDPVEVFRQSLADAPKVVEARPPVIERAAVLPYPDLARVWVRIQTSPFSSFPDLALTLQDPDGATCATMFVVEAREPYQSLTMHLRQPSRAGEVYQLRVELLRDHQELDSRLIQFVLAHEEPPNA
jgi:hypothetical protein